MTRTTKWRIGILACLVLVFVGVTSAADPPKNKNKTTYLNGAEAGLDYALQGELTGFIRTPAWGYLNCGLQVIALGDGKFEAVVYRGGLPGGGWDQQNKLKLNGNSNEQKILWLETEDFKLAVTIGTAQAFDIYGSPAGTMRKVHRSSPTMCAPPPSNAVVLFGGKTTDELKGAKLTDDGLLLAGVLTKMPVGDFFLHLEFRTPFMPYAKGQARGNSGVYIQQRYEVQILDSFGLEGKNNECGGLYTQTQPDVNMCFPPLAWQTYDIYFSQPKWDEKNTKKKTQNARLTVFHNGVLIHNQRDVPAKTGGGKPEGIETFPINLQDHGNPVTFRNIWLVPDQGNYVPPATVQGCVYRRW